MGHAHGAALLQSAAWSTRSTPVRLLNFSTGKICFFAVMVLVVFFTAYTNFVAGIPYGTDTCNLSDVTKMLERLEPFPGTCMY